MGIPSDTERLNIKALRKLHEGKQCQSCKGGMMSYRYTDIWEKLISFNCNSCGARHEVPYAIVESDGTQPSMENKL